MWKPGRRICALFLGVLMLACESASTQSNLGELPLEAVLHVLNFGDFRPSLSPNGKWLAYVIQDPLRAEQVSKKSQSFFLETGAPVAAAGTDVWITNTDSGESTNLTEAKGRNWAVSWSPDSNLLAFCSDRDGAARLWLYDIRKRTMNRASEVIVRVLDPWQIPAWSPDSKTILTKILAAGRGVEQVNNDQATSDRATKQEDSQPGAKILIYRSSMETASLGPTEHSDLIVKNDQTRAESSDLGAINVETGMVQRMARGFYPVWYSWSPNGTYVVFATMKGLYRGEVYKQLFDLFTVFPGGETKMIDSGILRSFWDFAASWSPDGTELSYVIAGGDDNGECYLVPLTGQGRRRATKSPHPSFSPFHQKPLWDASGQHLYFVTATYALWTISLEDGQAHELARIPNHRIFAIASSSSGSRVSSSNGGGAIVVSTTNESSAESEFYVVDLAKGKFTKLWSENKGYDPYRVVASADARKVIYAAEDIAHPPDFFVFDAEFKVVRQLTNTNPALARFQMGQGRIIQWRTEGGEVVQGALLLPSDYEEGKKYPLIVEVYPGLFSPCVNQFGLCGENFFPNKQLFANRGYAVLVPDLPLTGRTMLRDLASIVLSGVNKAIDLGFVDADRLGLMGTSWGGYSTLALLVQTTRFKAAIMVAGFGDLLGFYGEMDAGGASLGVGILEEGNGKFRMPGTPWNYRDLYLENSPILYLDRVETPLLIIHGTQDTNVAPFLSDEVFVGLRRLKKQVTYVKYVGEVHGIHAFENQVDSFKRMIQWFDTYSAGSARAPLSGDKAVQ
jgi:dipeptidyl aminopeptidase/acylaminoacyl peptidase